MLLIACTNVASLLLARGEDRKREIATRAALGTTSVRAFSIRSSLRLYCTFWYGVLGLLFASATVQLLSAENYLHVENAGAVTLDIRVLFFAILVSIATGVVFGLMPALQACRSNFNDDLKLEHGKQWPAAIVRTLGVCW